MDYKARITQTIEELKKLSLDEEGSRILEAARQQALNENAPHNLFYMWQSLRELLAANSDEPEKTDTSFTVQMPDGCMKTFKTIKECNEWVKIKSTL